MFGDKIQKCSLNNNCMKKYCVLLVYFFASRPSCFGFFILKKAKVPFAFMTNGGGGKTEKEYAKEIFKKLFKACNSHGVEENLDMSPSCITADHMVLCCVMWGDGYVYVYRYMCTIIWYCVKCG
jgi:hypothetical protein